jgi:hypothetical protein
MRKINLVIIHESHKSRDEISLILKKNFPLINIIDTYNTNSVDLSKSIKNNADLFLISSKVDLTLNKNIIEKIKTNSEFILLVNNDFDAFYGFKFGAIDVIEHPFTLEKFLYSINKYYWKFFLKLNK